MRLFTLRWTRGRDDNVIIKAIDESGRIYKLVKKYRDWIGVCTLNIDKVVKHLKKAFVGACISHQKLTDHTFTEILPLFYDRIKYNDMNTHEMFFYKVYIENTNMADVGEFLDNRHVSYHQQEDWLTRVYLDVCTKLHCADEFYYRWYEIDLNEPRLMESLLKTYSSLSIPRMTIASFDLETVPWQVGAKRMPTGHDAQDVVVMASLVLGDVSTGESEKKYLFYLNPTQEKLTTVQEDEPDTEYREHFTEEALLKDFFSVLTSPEIIFVTGYNINNFDFPCLFARAIYRNCEEIVLFSSKKMGKHTITTFCDKYVLDMYTYMLLFANKSGLSSFKLDDVAFAKLGERKVPVRATAIGYWYQARDRLDKQILESTDLTECYERVRPDLEEKAFGTFRRCLSYCLKDSELVLRLAHHENAVQFLLSRSNVSSMNCEEVLYHGITRYIQNFFETFGTTLGYFVNAQKLRNVTGDREHGPYIPASRKKYQGALNLCRLGFYTTVSVYDFESLYPSAITVGNISYETFAVVHADDLRRVSDLDRCQVVPYQVHDGTRVFYESSAATTFSLPTLGDTHDDWVMVWLRDRRGFLPHVISQLKEARRHEKSLMMSGGNKDYHNTRQLNLKLLMNSMYGVLGSTDSPLSNVGAGMSVTCIARTLLLNAFRFVRSRGCSVPYVDTDSLFVVNAPRGLHEQVNEYFGMPNSVNLQFENVFPSILLLMKKKYCYELYENCDRISTKGIEVKSNALTKRMLRKVLWESYQVLKQGRDNDPSGGWCLLTRLLLDARLESRMRPFENCKTIKVQQLDKYSSNCQTPHVRLLRRNVDRKFGDFISFVYLQTNVSQRANHEVNPVFVEDIDPHHHLLDFEKLYKSQHTDILNLLNLGFLRYDSMALVKKEYYRLVHDLKWQQVVACSIEFMNMFDEQPLVLVQKSVRYAFITKPHGCWLSRGRKRKARD